jgi:alcohol dehydrogenase
MTPFDFQPRTRIVFGLDKIEELGRLALELGARRALVVSDAGVIEAGQAQRGLDTLQDAGLDTALFQDFRENPTTEDTERGAVMALDFEPEVLIGLGGGSSLDCAKGINFVYSNGGRMQDYWGVDKATLPMLPMIAVPTTAGTGSEAQSFALISDAETHVKMACGDKKAACRIALLDPQLTVTQPQRVTALTGLDALAHALETQVTKPRNLISQTFSREAWRLLAANYVAVLDRGEDLEARSGMQLGACLAGLAIENSMLGAAHALANPLTAAYNIVHGEAVALMLPHVIRFNGEAVAACYADLLRATAGIAGIPTVEDGVAGLAQFVERVREHAGLAQRLSECGVERDRLPQLAAEAAKQWTGTFNPRDVTETDWLTLYEQAW